MYLVQIIIFLVFNSALKHINAIPSSVVIGSPADVVGIELSQGQTKEQYIQAVTDFWTDERLKTAKPKSILQIDSSSLDKSFHDGRTSDINRKPITIEGTEPISLKNVKRDGYPITVGKVFFVDGDDTYMCSASAVTSDNKDMIFTAGHCIFSTQYHRYVKNLVFIPQYDSGSRPYGTWPARCFFALTEWVQRLDHNSDVAIVLLYTLNDQHIQDVVGSQGVGFNHGHSATIYSFGYPRNYEQGEIMTYCTSTKSSADISNYNGDKMVCQMNQGCSGGPWFESYNQAALSGIQTSVNSFMLESTPGVMYGPYFSSVVQSLYETANRNDTCPPLAQASNTTISMLGLLSLLFLQFFNRQNIA